MNIQDEDFTKLKNQSLVNIIKKIKAGKVPTRQEWEFLEEARAAGEEVPPMMLDKFPKTTKQDAKMKAIIAEQFLISDRKAYMWLEKLENMKKGGVWNVAEILSCIQERKDAASSGGGLNADLKRELIQEQVDYMRAKRMDAEKKLVPVEEVNQILVAISTVMNSGLEQFVSYVSAEYSDPRSIEVAQRIANDVRRHIRSKIERD